MSPEISWTGSDHGNLYADEISALSGIRSPALRAALAKVPREDFLPAGPWIIQGMDGRCFRSEDDNPRHVLHAVGVMLSRQGHPAVPSANPALVARAMESTGFLPGDHVLHVGGGLGYFSALMAELVGPEGRVVVAEIDPILAEAARRNLSPWPNVEVVGDALDLTPQPYDVVFASAGMATIPATWIHNLNPGGRMMLPLTGSFGTGFLFRFLHIADQMQISAKLESFVGFYPCAGVRDSLDLAALDSALADGRAPHVAKLRTDRHEKEDDCWLHRQDWCMSLTSR